MRTRPTQLAPPQLGLGSQIARRARPLRSKRGTATRSLSKMPRGYLELRSGAGHQTSAVRVPMRLAAPAVGHHCRRKIVGYDPALVMSVRVRARNTKPLIPKVRREDGIPRGL